MEKQRRNLKISLPIHWPSPSLGGKRTHFQQDGQNHLSFPFIEHEDACQELLIHSSTLRVGCKEATAYHLLSFCLMSRQKRVSLVPELQTSWSLCIEENLTEKRKGKFEERTESRTRIEGKHRKLNRK